MSDSHSLSSSQVSSADFICDESAECCQDDVNADQQRIDGAGEPCPTPMVWQEIRDKFLNDSMSWEFVRGPHRLVGRTWGEGPPLYFLNNFAATAELFSLTAWLLKDHFRCVLFDSVPDDRRSIGHVKPLVSDFADDLFAVADQQGDQRFSVYAAGFGAAVGLQAAISRPERIERLVLQHGFASRRLSLSERILLSICLRSRQTLDRLPQRRRFQAVNHQPWFPPFDHSRFEFLVESTGSLFLQDLARRAWAVNSFNVETQLSKIDCPVLLLRTEGEGRMAAQSQEVLERRLKNQRTEWMHSAGQHPCLTHPHRVAKLVKSFFGSDETARRN
jgi:pimeloyl-ACP methyl ester carboxylesterase